MSGRFAQMGRALMEGLELDRAPVQISYLPSAPTGIPRHPGGAPSVCTFFAEGTERSFYADLAAHEACEVGAFVLGIPPEGELGDRLRGTLGQMGSREYLSPAEVARVPHNAKPPRFVAYGPLGTLPVPPTTVLALARPRGAMLAAETTGYSAPLLGRPMCSIVPTLVAGTQVAISAGCIGSRIYAGLGDDVVIVGLRGDHLPLFLQRLKRVRAANDWLAGEVRSRKDASSAPTPRRAPRGTRLAPRRPGSSARPGARPRRAGRSR
ncbi:MAG: DUF169 domain-containing protein [Thermoplasmata archaeon]